MSPFHTTMTITIQQTGTGTTIVVRNGMGTTVIQSGIGTTVTIEHRVPSLTVLPDMSPTVQTSVTVHQTHESPDQYTAKHNLYGHPIPETSAYDASRSELAGPTIIKHQYS